MSEVRRGKSVGRGERRPVGPVVSAGPPAGTAPRAVRVRGQAGPPLPAAPGDRSAGADAVVSLLLEMLERAYSRTSWHGPNLVSVVRGLSPDRVTWRPAPGRHNIAEQVLHAAYWKYAARRRLRGDTRGSFPIKGSNWFAVPDPLSRPAWRGHLAVLDDEHRTLCQAVVDFDPARLGDPLPGARAGLTARALILGVAAHDVYHAGQIRLLKRLHDGG